MVDASVKRVLITHKNVEKSALDFLAQSCEVVMMDCVQPNRSEVLKATREAASKPGGVLWCCCERLDDEILEAAGPSLRVIATLSSGLDLLDLDAIRKRGIRVGNTLKVVDEAVANTAITLALSATRRFYEGRLLIEDGTWMRSGFCSLEYMLGQDVEGSTIGIVGLGGIGSAIARKLRAFDVARIVYSGRTDKPNAKELGAERVTFPELLRVSDIVVAACPLTKETKGMFNADAFRQMKRTATFVNVGRGLLVDQDALISALKTGDIFAAGLDVMYPEPLPPDHPLLKLPNAVVTPHLAWATRRTVNAMAMLTAENILAGLKGEPLPSQVM